MVFPSLFYDLGTVFVKLYITSTYNNVSCRVRVPNRNLSYSFDLIDGYKELELNKSLMAAENMVGDSGIEITASEDVSVYAMKRDYFTRTAFLVLPYRSLSNHYSISSVKPTPYNNGLHLYNSTITIVSATDKNTVDIKLRFNGTIEGGKNGKILRSEKGGGRQGGGKGEVRAREGGEAQPPVKPLIEVLGQSYIDGNVARISLNKYESFVLSTHEFDLTGTMVKSVDPVAVAVGNNCGRLYSGNACSGMYTMVPPVSNSGQAFIIPSLKNHDHGFKTRIVAAHDLTKLTISIGDNETDVILDRNQWHDIDNEDNSPVYVESNHGVQVTQITPGKNNTDGKGTAFMMYVPAISQYRSEYCFSVPNENLTSYASIICRDESKLRLDNEIVSGNNVGSVEASEGLFQVVEIPLTPGHHKIHGIDSRAFSVFVYGKMAPSLGYGYNVGYYIT